MKSLRNRIRAFNKRYFNPMILKSAGTTRSPFAVIHHTGRNSHKPYTTPIIVEQTKNGFVIAMTYGPEVDWYRNILAAGQGTLLWHGREYVFDRPVPLEKQTALKAFPLFPKCILRILSIQHFLSVPSRYSPEQEQEKH